MVEPELSSIPDREQNLSILLALLDDFRTNSVIKIQLRRVHTRTRCHPPRRNPAAPKP